MFKVIQAKRDAASSLLLGVCKGVNSTVFRHYSYRCRFCTTIRSNCFCEWISKTIIFDHSFSIISPWFFWLVHGFIRLGEEKGQGEKGVSTVLSFEGLFLKGSWGQLAVPRMLLRQVSNHQGEQRGGFSLWWTLLWPTSYDSRRGQQTTEPSSRHPEDLITSLKTQTHILWGDFGVKKALIKNDTSLNEY